MGSRTFLQKGLLKLCEVQVHGLFKAGIFIDDLQSLWSELKSREIAIAFEPFFDEAMQCSMFAVRDIKGNILQFFGV
jgi:hypothetical protein